VKCTVTRALGLLSHFQVTSSEITSLRGHFRSPEVTWLPPTASYSLVGSEMYCVREFSAFYRHFQVTSGQTMSLPGHFRSPEVTWCHFHHVTASHCELQPCRKWNVQYTRVLGLPQPLPGDLRSNDVTSGSLPVTRGHVTSFFSHVTASYCDLQHCRKWNVQYTRVFGLLQPLPGDFWSNYATTLSLPVTWDHVTTFPVKWLPPIASYS